MIFIPGSTLFVKDEISRTGRKVVMIGNRHGLLVV